MSVRLRTFAILVTLAAALTAAGPAVAATWTALPSGTTDPITTIDYRGPSAYWYATTTGKIFKNGVQASVSGGGVPINRLAMSPDGTKGIAVGNSGKIFRSTDGGSTWAAEPAVVSYPNTNCSGGAGAASTVTESLTGLSWADNSTVYADGPTSSSLLVQPILKSTNGGTTWSDINRPSSGSCLVNDSGVELTDVAAVKGTNTVYLVARSFGATFVSYDALTSVTRGGSAVDHLVQPQVAVAPENPNIVYVVDREADGIGLNFALSTDSGMTYKSFVFGNANANLPALYGVAASGSTMVAAGDAGGIYMSTDAQTAYRISDTGPFAATPWRTVSLASPASAAVAGAGGVIAYSTDVNTIPDTIAPSGSINDPGTVTALKPAQFTATLTDNAGGSGIDPNSISWSATSGGASPVTGTGNPTTLTFPSAGVWSVTVTFKDLAGNAASAYRNVTVGNPPPANPGTKTTTVGVPGAKISLGVPNTCVNAGAKFKVTLAWKKQRRKGNKFIKITRTDFYNGRRRVKIVRRPPFVATLTVKSGTKPGAKVKVRARAFMKVKHGKQPTKSISTTITTCK